MLLLGDALDDRLAPDEPRYRSRGEAQIGRLLDHYGIPFLYEQPTPVCDEGRMRVLYPDFTLPARDNLLIEYAGMMDQPEYAFRTNHKQRVYAANGFQSLFLYPRDIVGPRWTHGVLERIAYARPNTSKPRWSYPQRPTYGRRWL